MNFIDYINKNKGNVFVNIKVIPNSSKTEFVEQLENGVLKIKAKGIPEKGRVNKEIINFFSKELNIKKEQIEITKGLSNRNKTLKISF